MRWDHFTTVRNALWIGGGQWAGKTTVAGILADRFLLTHYHYDYHDARGHWDRRTARICRAGAPPPEPEPGESADRCLRDFPERFEFVLDDLRALQSPRPILADGWGLRPELVVPVTSSPRRMVVLVPTEEFQRVQAGRLPRAAALGPARLTRNRLVAADAVASARRLGIRVIEVDGSRDAEATADVVADHWAEFL